MQLLYEEGMIIGDIAKKLDLPASSTAFHLKILEEAGCSVWKNSREREER